MAAQSGLATQMTAPVDEVTYGVVPAALAATTKFSAFTGETMRGTKTAVQGIGLLANRQFPQAARRVVAEWTAGGGVNMDLPARGLQQWLFPMFGSKGQAASALTQDASTGAYKAVHAPGFKAGKSYCFQKGMPAADTSAVEPFTYTGGKCTEWELSAQRAQIAQLATTWDARNELAGAGNSDPLNGSVPGLVSYVAPPAGGVFHFAQSQIFTGGTCTTTSGVTSVASPVAAGNVLSFTVKMTTPLNTTRYFAGKAGFKDDQLDNALSMVSVTLVVEWLSSQARYNAYAADTPTPVELQFVGPAIGTGSDFSTFSLLIPDMFIDEAPVNVGGPEVVSVTYPLTGLDDGTNNVIQATYWTLDST
jgi:hypothetical protein